MSTDNTMEMMSEALSKLANGWRGEAEDLKEVADYPTCPPLERVGYVGGAARIERMANEVDQIVTAYRGK